MGNVCRNSERPITGNQEKEEKDGEWILSMKVADRAECLLLKYEETAGLKRND